MTRPAVHGARMRRPKDDASHSQLTKAEKPAQVLIDALGRGAGRTTFGPTRVEEMASGSALTDFTMGGHVTGAAWSLNPYVGCLHGCRYCYVPETMHVQRGNWGRYVIAKSNIAVLLRRELEEKPRLTVFLSTSTDPYQSLEQERRITRSCLQLLARKDWPVDILTRSPLVLRDMDVLRRLSQVRVGLSIPTLDEAARRVLEPNAPPVGVRLSALRQLADAGLTTYANYSPAYPPTDGSTAADVARELNSTGVQWVNTSTWRRQAGYLAGLWDELRTTQWSPLVRFVGSPRRQAAYAREVRSAFQATGLRLRTGFFNEPFPARSAPRAVHAPLDVVGADRPCS